MSQGYLLLRGFVATSPSSKVDPGVIESPQFLLLEIDQSLVGILRPADAGKDKREWGLSAGYRR